MGRVPIVDDLGAISVYSVFRLIVTIGKQNSAKYCSTLENGLIPFVGDTFCDVNTWIFQQDPSPINTSLHTVNI